MKSEPRGSSATLTHTPDWRASARTVAFTAGSSVAATARLIPARSPERYRRCIRVTAALGRSRRKATENSGLTATTRAPAASRPPAFLAATDPPPTTSTRRPASDRTTG